MKGAVGGTAILSVVLPVLLIFLLVVTQEPLTENGGEGAGDVRGSGLAAGSVPREYMRALTDAGDQCAAVSAPLLAAQVNAESSFSPHAVSPAGAEGIAQFLPSTWATWGKDYSGDGRADIWNPEDAIGSQAVYMCHIASMIKAAMDKGRVKGDLTRLMLAGYNVGEFAVIAAGGMPAMMGAAQYAAKIIAAIPRYTATGAEGSGRAGSSSLAAAAIKAARAKLGTPYVFGASGPDAYDCSSYIQYAYRAASNGRIDIGRLTYDQVESPYAREVSLDALIPGDLVFIHVPGDAQGGWNHVVMFIGNKQLIEEPRPGEVARIMPMSEYAGYSETARRIVDPAAKRS